MVNSIGRPTVESVRKVAAILCGGDTDAIWAVIGTGHRDYGPFDLSHLADELSLLSTSQRKALTALIRSMADPVAKRHVPTSSAETLHPLRVEIDGDEIAATLDSGEVLRFPRKASAPDGTVDIAALDVDPDLDEPAGGSQEGE